VRDSPRREGAQEEAGGRPVDLHDRSVPAVRQRPVTVRRPVGRFGMQ
jgi:hypothetical protein